jgi:hypothetical protein
MQLQWKHMKVGQLTDMNRPVAVETDGVEVLMETLAGRRWQMLAEEWPWPKGLPDRSPWKRLFMS